MSQRIDEKQARAIQQQNTTLIWAATQGYETIVKAMLALPGTYPLAFDPSDTHGKPPLHLATEKGHADVVSVILEHSSPNALDKSNDTALIWAAYYGHSNVVDILLANPETDLNIVNSLGNSALLLAASYGRHEIILNLLKLDRINLKLQNNDNYTVFTYLFKVQNTPAFNALLTACAKWRLNADKDEISFPMLDSLKPHKENLFAALMQLSPENQLKAVKKIIEDKETTALGKVFWYKKSSLDSIDKGTMATIHAKYFELTGKKPAEEKILPAATITLAETTLLTPAIYANIFSALTTGKGPINGNELLQWLSETDINVLTPTILGHAKKFKTPLLDAINALGDNKAKLEMFEKIFDEKVPGKKNDKTALGKVFWAGTPDLYENRLGEAYKCYFALKFPGKTFVKPEKPSIVSEAFTSIFSKITNKTQTVETAFDFRNSKDAF